MEGDPNKKMNIVAFADYGNEFVGAAMMLKSGVPFSDVLEIFKKHPAKTVEEYLDLQVENDTDDYRILLHEHAANPVEMRRLSDIAKAMNSLEAHEEARFKDLVDEAWGILQNGRTYFD